MKLLGENDPQIAALIEKEKQRQMKGIELIPSENFTSMAVMEAMGSVLTNKYSEGYPGKRYYGGNQFVDKIEKIAIERAKNLFGAEHVNVQPYSGSPANVAVYFGLLNFGDKIMGLSLAHGGHLTHGHGVSFSGKAYKSVPYTLDEDTHMLNYDSIRKLAEEHRPRIIVSGFTAYPRTVDFRKFAEIAKDVGAISMADISHIAGIIAAGLHPSPFPFTDVVTTTTHKTLRGPRGAIIMCRQEFAEKIDKSVFPGLQGGPHDNITAAKAVALKEASTESFRKYIEQVLKNARHLADCLKQRGFDLVTGGTDNHLILIDLSGKGVTGRQAEEALDSAGITVNKNMVPYDKRTPFDPSGIRIGTPMVTTRGMKESEMKAIATWISEAMDNVEDSSRLEKIRSEVEELCKGFVFYD